MLVVGIFAIWMQINSPFNENSVGGNAPGAADADKPCEDGIPGDIGNENGGKMDANNAPSGDYIDGNGCPERNEIFSKYGAGYDGGYTVCVPDQSKAAELADIFDAEFDGRAFTMPYTEEAFDTLSQYGYAHCGDDGDNQCIIVFIK